jgi:hypothetical protein
VNTNSAINERHTRRPDLPRFDGILGLLTADHRAKALEKPRAALHTPRAPASSVCKEMWGGGLGLPLVAGG